MAEEIFKLFTDGGARGNPGPAGLGAIIFNPQGKLVDFTSKFVENATNNTAEYEALIMGLKLAQKNQISILNCYLDSELAVKQLNGEYRIKEEHLKSLKNQVEAEATKFEAIKFIHVERSLNKFADRLVNLAMDARLK